MLIHYQVYDKRQSCKLNTWSQVCGGDLFSNYGNYAFASESSKLGGENHFFYFDLLVLYNVSKLLGRGSLFDFSI